MIEITKSLFIFIFIATSTLLFATEDTIQLIEDNQEFSLSNHMKSVTSSQFSEAENLGLAFRSMLLEQQLIAVPSEDLGLIAKQFAKVKAKAADVGSKAVAKLCLSIKNDLAHTDILDAVVLAQQVVAIEKQEQQARLRGYRALLQQLSVDGQLIVKSILEDSNPTEIQKFDYVEFAHAQPETFKALIIPRCDRYLQAPDTELQQQLKKQLFDASSKGDKHLQIIGVQ